MAKGLELTSHTFTKALLGIAHAIGLCEGFVGGDRFIVYLGA
jgi:dTDP-glucose pyrophosphorylase